MQMFLPIDSYGKAMEFSGDEVSQFSQIATHVFFGLHSENLIEGAWQMGNVESLKKIYSKAESNGIVCQPSALGAELFLWAFGKAEHPLDFIFDERFKPIVHGLPFAVEGSVATQGG